MDQLNLPFNIAPAEPLTEANLDDYVDQFIEGRRAEGFDDYDLQLLTVRLHFEQTKDFLSKVPANMREAWIVWLVEEFLG